MPITRRFRGLRVLGLGHPDHRREVIDLLADPTDALRRVRCKADAGSHARHKAIEGTFPIPSRPPARLANSPPAQQK